MRHDVDFDHVALALPERGPFWSMFAGDLAGRWVGGGETLGGFAFGQVRFAGGMKVEGLEPFAPEHNDFLVRFLATAGPGPHHLTFKVPDLPAALESVRSAGYEPTAVDLTSAQWKEGFLHPRQAAGVLVQLAEEAGELATEAPPWLPPPRVASAAELVHVAHAVADLDHGLALFKGVLGGRSVDAGAGGGLGWVDLAWAGAGRLRLLAGDPVASFLAGRPGRLHHLAFRVGQPGGVAGAVERAAWWEVPAEPPLGTRLILVEPDAPAPLGL